MTWCHDFLFRIFKHMILHCSVFIYHVVGFYYIDFIFKVRFFSSSKSVWYLSHNKTCSVFQLPLVSILGKCPIVCEPCSTEIACHSFTFPNFSCTLHSSTNACTPNSTINVWTDLPKPDITTHFRKFRFLHQWVLYT